MMMAGRCRVANPEIQQRIDRLVALSRIKRERDNLLWDLNQVRTKLKRIGPTPVGLREQRAYQLRRKEGRILAQLEQLPLLI